MKEKINLKWLYWFAFAVAVIFVYKILDNLNDISIWLGNLISIVMPFIIGILLAYLLYIPCRAIEKIYGKSKVKIINKRARGLSVITVFVLAIVLIIMIINL